MQFYLGLINIRPSVTKSDEKYAISEIGGICRYL